MGPVPDWRFREMSADDAETIIAWRYTEPYAFYDTVLDPELVEAFRGEEHRRLRDLDAEDDLYVAVDGAAGELAGFFGYRGAPADCRIGLGLAPERTGRSLGAGFVAAGLEFARRRWGARFFRLEVASFNQRAIVVYERLGFTKRRSFERSAVERQGETVEFIEMVLGTEEG